MSFSFSFTFFSSRAPAKPNNIYLYMCVYCFPTHEKTQKLEALVNVVFRLIINLLRKVEQIWNYEALPVLCVVFGGLCSFHGIGVDGYFYRLAIQVGVLVASRGLYRCNLLSLFSPL